MMSVISFFAFFFLGLIVVNLFDVVIQVICLLVMGIKLLFTKKKS